MSISTGIVFFNIKLFSCQINVYWSSYVSSNFLAERRTPEGGKEYFVKWESLPYSEATWEVADLIKTKWSKKIKEFREREDSKRTPSKLTRALKYRPKFHQVLEQPEYMGGDQVTCFHFIWERNLNID